MRRNLAEDGMLAAVDRLVLVIHDGSSTRRLVLSEIPRKPGDGRDNNDDTEFPTGLASSHTGIDNGTSDGVEDRGLLVAGSRD